MSGETTILSPVWESDVTAECNPTGSPSVFDEYLTSPVVINAVNGQPDVTAISIQSRVSSLEIFSNKIRNLFGNVKTCRNC